MRIKSAIAIVLILTVILSASATAATKGQQVVSVALTQLGKPYMLNSDAPNSFNCASFVIYCYNKVASGKITTSGISGSYSKITSASNLKEGDVVCFKTTQQESGILGCHFGIYMGRGYFIHASSSAGMVTVSKMKNYKKRFVGALRVF